MKQQLRWTGLLAALILGISVLSCDPLDGDDDGGSNDPDSGPPPSGIFLKKAGETATADFSSALQPALQAGCTRNMGS